MAWNSRIAKRLEMSGKSQSSLLDSMQSSGRAQTQPLNFQTHTSKQKQHRTKMLRIEEETLVKVVEKGQNYDCEIPLDRAKLRLVTRLKKTDHTIAERKAEDHQDNRQASQAHFERDVQKAI